MTIRLYYTTDTTGRFLYRESNDDARQPHMCRLAMCLVVDATSPAFWCRLIKPKNEWSFDPESVANHGIAPAMAYADGVSLENAMEQFTEWFYHADELIAFNADFHWRVLQRSRADLHDVPLPDKPQTCLMRTATPIVRKPRMQPGGAYAWPKFSEAHAFFCGGSKLPESPDPVARGRAQIEAVHAIHRAMLQWAK